MHTPLKLVFYFILPEKGGGRDAQKGGLTTSNWTKWRKNMDKINNSLLYSTLVNKKLYFLPSLIYFCFKIYNRTYFWVGLFVYSIENP